jgi:hypothetical protein
MKQTCECPRCGKEHINNRALSEHIHRKNACDPLKSNVPIEELHTRYPKPALKTCADCNRQFSRRALHDHITNRRCPVVREREAAAASIAPHNNDQPPPEGTAGTTAEHAVAAPVPRRSYNDPDLSFITREDLESIYNHAIFQGDLGLTVLYRCVFDRCDQRQNYELIVCKNVRSSNYLHYWVADEALGGYRCIEGSEPLKEALKKPMELLWQHVETKGMMQKPAWLEGGTQHYCSSDKSGMFQTALKYVAAFLECKARIKRGCNIDGASVSNKVQSMQLLFPEAFA